MKRARQWLKPEEKLRRQQKKNDRYFGATENWEQVINWGTNKKGCKMKRKKNIFIFLQLLIVAHRNEGFSLKKVDEAAEWLLSQAEEFVSLKHPANRSKSKERKTKSVFFFWCTDPNRTRAGGSKSRTDG